jgi:hypothetical protein
VEKGPSWPATASEVTGAGEVVGVLRRGVLYGLEETAVELSVASMPEQGKRKERKSRLGCAHKGKRGVRCRRRHVEAGGEWGPAWRAAGIQCARGQGTRGGGSGRDGPLPWAGPSTQSQF